MSNRLRKHAKRHEDGGLDPLDLEKLAGVISDVQHGTKTTIPNAHHPQVHKHAIKAIFMASLYEKSTVTTLPNWDVLCYSPVLYNVSAGFLAVVNMCCNFRVSGTGEGRGAELSLWRGDGSGYGIPDVQLTPAMEILYGDTLYKIITYCPTYMESAGFSELDYVICWRAMDWNYPPYSKNNYLAVFVTQTT